MNKYIAHFRTIAKHKLLVMKFCFKCGLIWRGLMHDNSKFGPTEFWASARYWQGNRSPIDAEKEVKGYSLAWQHHKGHNPHHWEYWLDNLGTYQNTGLKMPIEYVIEMICDWLAAGIVYGGNKVNYDEPYDIPRAFYNSKKKERIFHPETQKLIEHFLDEIAEDGINYFCEYWKYEEITYEYVNGRLQG